MLLAVEWGTGQVLWSILWFFLFVLWIWLVITIFADIMRSDDLSGWGKALWALAIIVVPFFGIFVYLIVRGGQMSDRAVEDARRQQEQVQAYVRDTAGQQSTSEQLSTISALRESGQLSDEEFETAKAKILG